MNPHTYGRAVGKSCTNAVVREEKRGPDFKFNESVSFQVFCKDQAEIDHYWNKLSQGGQIQECGWLKDKFGLSWQVVPAALSDDERAVARCGGIAPDLGGRQSREPAAPRHV